MAALPAAVLWDLDGTIIDTEPYWIECEYELVSQYGGTWTDEDAHSIVGFDLLEAAAVMRERAGIHLAPQEIVDRLVAGVIARLRVHLPWRPGARELLAALGREGVPCALVTMSWRSITDEVLRQMPPGTFGTVVTGDSVLNGKPHPEPYRRAAADLGVDPLSCVAIEDSPTGVASAEAAGCVVVAVPNVVGVPPAPHRVLLPTLVGLTPADLGEFVETTPPPTDLPDDVPPARPPRRPMTRNEQRQWGARRFPTGRGRLVLAGAALVLALVAGGIWWLTSRESTHHIEPGAFNVQTWAIPSQLERAATDLDQNAGVFHQISPFWYETTGATAIGPIDDPGYDPDLAAQFIADARARGIPLVASILDHNGKGGMAAIIADPAQRTAHIDTIAAFASSNDFDGIDIDYENFAFTDDRSTWDATKENFATFIAELSERLHADGRLLTVSVPPVGTDKADYWVYDYRAIAPHVDSIRIMAYDYTTLTEPPGPIAPLPWVTEVIDAATEAVGSPDKLVLGIPLYAHNRVTATTGECPTGTESSISQSRWRVDELIQQRNPTPPAFDPVNAETSFTYQLTHESGGQSCVQTREVQYLDDQGIRLRMQLSVDKGMKGVALFAFGYEAPSLFSEIAAIEATLTPATTVADGAAA